jgi:hypothetical protein
MGSRISGVFRFRPPEPHALRVTSTRLDSVLSRQHGLVTRAQARRAGLSDRQITRRINDRRLIAVHRGVLRHSAFPVSHEQRIRAALLALGGGAAVSHRTAAGLIGVSGIDVRFVEVTWPARRRAGSTASGCTACQISNRAGYNASAACR